MALELISHEKLAESYSSAEPPVNPQLMHDHETTQTVLTGLNELQWTHGGGFDDHPEAFRPIKLGNYQFEEERIKSFVGWPLNEAHAEQMAAAGFVYTGQEDLVYCFSCNIKLDRWSKHMEPLLRHKEESPTCSFMRQKLRAIEGEKGKTMSVVAPSKPLNARLTSSIGQLQSSSLITSKAIHTVVTGLNESRLSYGGSFDDRRGASLPITPENYQSEEERIKSFVGWPLNEAVHPEQLARVGFVYTGEGALVQCFQCGVKYRHWYKGDVPLSVHQKCNPRCPFLQILNGKSKAIFPEQHIQPSKSYIEPESIGSNTQGEKVSMLSLQFPDYSEEAVRLQSFKHWGGVLPAQELAKGGFYMIARHDVVRCFSCDVVVQDWESGGNVVKEHYRHSPNCEHLHRFSSMKDDNSVEKSLVSDSHENSTVVISNSATSNVINYYSEQFVGPPQPAGVQGSDKEMELFEESTQGYHAVFPVAICEACNATMGYNELCPECNENPTKIKYLQM